MNCRTMSNLEKCLFNLKFAAGESKGKVMWCDKKKTRGNCWKSPRKRKYHSEKPCRSKDVCGKVQSVRKTKQSVSWEWVLRLRLPQPEFKLKPWEDSCLCQHIWTLIWNTECSNTMSGKKDEKCYRPDSSTQPTEYPVPGAAGDANLETGYSSAVLLPRSRLVSQKLAHPDQV